MLANPVAFKIGSVAIYWYGIIITLAILAATAFAVLELKRRKQNMDDILTLFLWIVPFGIIFARIAYVLFHPSDFFPWDSWSAVWNTINLRDGGISILGAIPGGALGAFCCYRTSKSCRKTPIGDTLDVVASAVLLGQGLGRWGNYVNQELYGELITDPKQQWFPWAVQIDAEGGQWFQATFFYEMVLNLIGFAFMAVLVRKSKRRWLCVFCYIAWYTACRAVMESIRVDAVSVGSVKIGVLGCALASVVSAIVAFLIWRGFIPTGTPKYLSPDPIEPDDLPQEAH